MALRKEEFPRCCGIEIITNFSLGYSIREIDEAINDFLKEPTKPNNYPDNYVYIPPKPKAITLIALNEKQHKRLHKMLIRKNFELITKGWNANHANMNYLYSICFKKTSKKYALKK